MFWMEGSIPWIVLDYGMYMLAPWMVDVLLVVFLCKMLSSVYASRQLYIRGGVLSSVRQGVSCRGGLVQGVRGWPGCVG